MIADPALRAEPELHAGRVSAPVDRDAARRLRAVASEPAPRPKAADTARRREADAPFSARDDAPATLGLPRDWTSTWLVLLTAAAMAFLASLALALAAGADALTRSWTAELEAKATVSLQLDGLDAVRDRARVADALGVLRAAPGVLAVRELSPEDVAEILAPWLGVAPAEALAEDLPLPTLIDVDLAETADPAALAATLAAAGHVAEVDAHGRWVERLAPAAARIRGLAYAGLAIIAASAALMVALACATALAAQAHMVDILRLVGASDAYVARLFVRRFQMLAFFGSAVGGGVAALALLIASAGSGAAEPGAIAPLLPNLAPDPWVWARLAAMPLAFALLATGAAWVAAMATLRRAER